MHLSVGRFEKEDFKMGFILLISKEKSVYYFCTKDSSACIYVTVETTDGFYGTINFVIRVFQTLFHEVFGYGMKT